MLAALAAALTSAHAADAGAGTEPCRDAKVPKVAFVFEGAQREPHREAVRKLSEQLGGSACLRTFDHVSSGVDPDANARFLLGSLGLQRYTLVFLLTPRHAEPMGRVVKQFPRTTYLQLGGRTQAANLIPYRLHRTADAAPFYRAAAQCALDGKPLQGPGVATGPGSRGRNAPALCI